MARWVEKFNGHSYRIEIVNTGSANDVEITFHDQYQGQIILNPFARLEKRSTSSTTWVSVSSLDASSSTN